MENEEMVFDDSNETSSESEDEEKKQQERATELEKQICDNKYIYQAHVDLVKIYRNLSDLKSMRAAYRRFSNYFPLTPAIWLTWIKDEIKLINSDSEKRNVLALFNKAVEDYQCVKLWLEYVQFCIGNCDSQTTYSVFEEGLSSVGLHVSEGSLLWDTLREFELAQLACCEPLSNTWHEQVKKVADVYRRQLSVPLLRMESTYTEWQEWLNSLPQGHTVDSNIVEWGYQCALKLLKTYKPFEEQLLAAKNDEDVLYIYQDYINNVTDPALILCLYERLVAILSLNALIWNKYCLFSFKLGTIANSITEKAIRNCPWSEDLWVTRLRVLEQCETSDEKIKETLEQGLFAIVPTPGLNLWLAYLDYVRRSSQSFEYLSKLFKQASEYLKDVGDPFCKILRLYAHLCAKNGNIAETRNIWTLILQKSANKTSFLAWLEYAALEKQFGDANHLRHLYEKALTVCSDSTKTYITEDWLMYERECGSLKDILYCEEKCNQITYSELIDTKTRKRKFGSYNDNTFQKQQKPNENLNSKPKISPSDMDFNKSVFLSNMRSDVKEELLQNLFPKAVKICIPTDKRGNFKCYAYVQFTNEDEVSEALKRDREPVDGRPLFVSKCISDSTQRKKTVGYSTESEKNKLFVRGLPTKLQQEDVENIFKQYGSVAVRLILYRSGQSKGIAYVEFENEEKAEEALKVTDQMNIDGHIITVSISAPPKKNYFNETPAPVSSPKNSFTNKTAISIRRSRNRLQLPLIPRSVQTKPEPSKAEKITKTNEDFRKLFTK